MQAKRRTGRAFECTGSRLQCLLSLVFAVHGASAFARGNENNRDQPDGTYYLGSAVAAGYAVVNLGIHYQVTRALRVVAQINNLFDRQYFTTAQLRPAGFTEAGTFIARSLPAVNGEFPLAHTTFLAPGTPAMFSISTRLRF